MDQYHAGMNPGGLMSQVDSQRQMNTKRINDSIQRNKAKYSLLKGVNVEGRFNDPAIQLHGGALETQAPGARDEEGKLINPTDSWIINVGDFNDPRIAGNLDNAILGDLLHTIRGNPDWAKMTNDVYGLRDEEQKAIDMNAYGRTVEDRYGGDFKRYPLSQFEDFHRKDAYTRSVIAPDNNADNWTNDEQKTYIEKHMIPYLKGVMEDHAGGG
jgi:hypothetical protein